MQGQHFEDEHVAPLSRAHLAWIFGGDGFSPRRLDAPLFMAPEGDLHGSVGRIGIVEMNPDEKHAFQQRSRRLAMPDSRFPGPCAKARHVASFTDGDHPILVPRHAPVRPRRFVERDNARRFGGRHELADRLRQRTVAERTYRLAGHRHTRPGTPFVVSESLQMGEILFCERTAEPDAALLF